MIYFYKSYKKVNRNAFLKNICILVKPKMDFCSFFISVIFFFTTVPLHLSLENIQQMWSR